MANFDDQLIGPRPYGLRLDTLVRLRWLAVAGQTITLLGVHFGLGFELPIVPALGMVALTACTNLILRARKPRPHRLDEPQAAMILGFDIVQLALLLYLTGGLANPFSELFLAPVLISATALSPRTTVILGILAVSVATVIGLYHHPLPWYADSVFGPPPLFILGMWVSVFVSVAFIGGYAFAVAQETRQLSDALAEAELVLAREQHLSALDGLAAAAAHELGTPLATIAIVVREMERELPADNPYRDDIKLLREQSERCRSILRTLTSLGSGEGPFDRMPLSHLLEELVTPHRPFGNIAVELPQDRTGEPVVARNPAILYGLGNIVENAVDFASEAVKVTARWSPEEVVIVVADDGPGFAPEVINRIGDPYVTIRGRRRGTEAETPGGLGLGFFIAKTLLERTGASLSLENRVFPETGAIVSVRWPRAAFELNLNRQAGAQPASSMEATPSIPLASARIDD
ncbi:MAG: ActS/PrrB/RegB family redox-sensitive histidine kinase [Bradyrhizobiaceae bacterium]|nr:ActS/PrrB/RegB family redox-sensitive histidine kinase [Bradyrhizobiaceae bacterium]